MKTFRLVPLWLVLSIGLIIYKLLVDYSYENIIAVLYDYQNFLIEPSFRTSLISWIIFILLFPLIIKCFNFNSISSNIVSILILISLVPTLTLVSYNNSYSSYYLVLIYVYWFILLYFTTAIPIIRILKKNTYQSPLLVNFITLLLCFSVIYISYIHTGLRFHFNLMTVYDLREEAREFQINFILGYLSTFADNTLPILIVYYLVKKNIFYSSLILFTIILNFGISGTKQVVFLLLFSLISFFSIQKLNFSKKYVLYFSSLVLAALLEYKYFLTFFISAFSLYRVFFIPAKLHYVYFKYFSVNELDYFRQSVLKWFIDSPYKINIGFLMGFEDIGLITGRANNGLFSDAFFNFGFIGILVFPLLLVIILKLIDGSCIGINPKVLFILVITVTFVLLNLPITTGLISAGILPLILILNLIPRKI